MFCLIYASVATRPLQRQALGDILAVSQRNNKLDDITGILLNAGGHFMQVLEGPQEMVENTYNRICDDQRHHITSVMLRQEIHRRVFPSWAMELLSINELSEERRALAERLLQVAEIGAPMERQRSDAELLLKSFRKSINHHRIKRLRTRSYD